MLLGLNGSVSDTVSGVRFLPISDPTQSAKVTPWGACLGVRPASASVRPVYRFLSNRSFVGRAGTGRRLVFVHPGPVLGRPGGAAAERRGNKGATTDPAGVLGATSVPNPSRHGQLARRLHHARLPPRRHGRRAHDGPVAGGKRPRRRRRRVASHNQRRRSQHALVRAIIRRGHNTSRAARRRPRDAVHDAHTDSRDADDGPTITPSHQRMEGSFDSATARARC